MRPFKEVILFDNVISGEYRDGLKVTPDTLYKLKQSSVQTIWSGSIEKFKSDFEIPTDAPLSTKETNLPGDNGLNGDFVKNWNWTTLNFKFNYQIWYRDSATTNTNNYYVNGSNNTIDITIPNVLLFNGFVNYNNATVNYASASPGRYIPYNPNLFPLPISINSFVISNKISNFQTVTGSGNDSLVYLVFRYGINGNDIEICLLTKDIGNFQVNSNTLIMPYASLTFTGFNKIKRLT